MKKKIDMITHKGYRLLTFFSLKLFKKRIVSEKFFIHFVRHHFIGGIGAFLNYVLFNVFMFISSKEPFNMIILDIADKTGLPKLDVTLSNALMAFIVLPTIFILQRVYTYSSKEKYLYQVIMFLVWNLIYIVSDTFFLHILINVLFVPPLIAKIITLGFLTPISFVFQKYIVFKEGKKTKAAEVR